MSISEITYTFVPQNDLRTGLSLGLSLAAALTTIIVFGILAHYGYISHTVAYSAIPSIGAALLLVGAAIALIRQENKTSVPPPPPPHSQSVDTPYPFQPSEDLNLVAYDEGNSIKVCAPDQAHPYWFYMAQLSNGEKTIEVEVTSFSDYEFKFIYNNNSHSTVRVSSSPEEYQSACARLHKENAFTRLDYRWLLEEQVGLPCAGRGSAHIFSNHHSHGASLTHTTLFSIPDSDPHQPYVWKEGDKKITFRRKERSPPAQSIKGLENHPEIVQKLRALEWTWFCPGEITEITDLGPKGIKVSYTFVE